MKNKSKNDVESDLPSLNDLPLPTIVGDREDGFTDRRASAEQQQRCPRTTFNIKVLFAGRQQLEVGHSSSFPDLGHRVVVIDGNCGAWYRSISGVLESLVGKHKGTLLIFYRLRDSACQQIMCDNFFPDISQPSQP